MILLIFDALFICVLCHFVVLLVVKSEKKKKKTKKKSKKKKKKKNLNLKTQYWFLEFPYKRNIHNSCDLPEFCYNYLANPQILKDARLTFF